MLTAVAGVKPELHLSCRQTVCLKMRFRVIIGILVFYNSTVCCDTRMTRLRRFTKDMWMIRVTQTMLGWKQ